ncbi:MAG: hypothetical protein O2884_08625 [Chloroflexi bacterium]|nr:hypothetical protein [Chloroflexota bacterium]
MCIGTSKPSIAAPPPLPAAPAPAPTLTDPAVQTAKDTTRKRAALAMANRNIATSPLGIASAQTATRYKSLLGT